MRRARRKPTTAPAGPSRIAIYGKTTLVTTTVLAALVLTPPLVAQWVDTLPAELQDAILWVGDHEEGTLYDWDKDGDNVLAGGCVCNTGDDEVLARATSRVAHSGSYSARTSISNAYRAENGSRAVRLMRWTDKFWDEGGQYFPDTAYYSAWFLFPRTYNPNKYAPWDPGDGGWWNVFQFKSEDEFCVSQPMWTLDIAHDDDRGAMYFYLYSKENPPFSYGQTGLPLKIPARRWVHVEALYVNSPTDGRITIWQDGIEILDVDGVVTSLDGCEDQVIWGIGNYTDHIAGGPVEGVAHIAFDDAVVATERISAAFDGTERAPLELEVVGTCPDPIEVRVAGATPGGRVAFAGAAEEGTYTLPAGPCAGTLIDLDDPGLLTTRRADVDGRLIFERGFNPLIDCRISIQALDLTSCATSDVVAIWP